MSVAYQLGWLACNDDKTLNDNPYPRETEDFHAWRQGWIEKDRHERDKSDVLTSLGYFGPTANEK